MADNRETEHKYILNIPQGFYGVISPNSDNSIKGILTEGLGPCSCLIVINSNRDYIFLAHVDGKAMNIGDRELGIVSWIKQIENYINEVNRKIDNQEGCTTQEGYITQESHQENTQENHQKEHNQEIKQKQKAKPKPQHDKESLHIHCGRGFQEGVKEETDYESEIKKILKANNLNYLINSNNIHIHETGNLSAGLALRNGTTIKKYKEGVAYVPDGRAIGGISDEIKELGFEIIDFGDHRSWRNDFMSFDEDELKDKIDKGKKIGSFIKQKYNITSTLKELPFSSKDQDTTIPSPPFCCYNGIGPFLNKGAAKITNIMNSLYREKLNEYETTLIRIYNEGSHTYKELSEKVLTENIMV